MASVKSLEKGFYYMHPRNRFWKTIGEVAGSEVPESIEAKKAWLKANNIALMDIIYSCERAGSLDSDIKKSVPNDITKVLKTANIKGIFCNGKNPLKLQKRLIPICNLYVFLPPLPQTRADGVKTNG